MRRSLVVGIYRALLLLLPPEVRREDGAEIAAAFQDLWNAAVAEGRRLRALRRGFGGLAAAIVLEWLQRARGGRMPAAAVRRAGWVDRGRWQLRQGVRSLLRAPSFAVSTVLLLGLGVGSVTTIFTIVDHVLLRPLPYRAANELVVVQGGSHSGPVFEDLQRFRSVSAWAAGETQETSLSGGDRVESVREANISRGFFTVFDARPAVGRLFVAEDFRITDRVVLSAGIWKRVFGADTAIVGRTVRLGNSPVVVIGVVAEDFVAPEAVVGSSVDVWRPIDTSAPAYLERQARLLQVAGRLAEGATLEAAQREADGLALQRAVDFPELYESADGGVAPLPVVSMQDATVGRVRRGLGLVLGAVTLLLLVACTNVAHLFMARGLARTPEMAVRRALGARMSTLTTQLLAESLLIGAGGALLGILIAFLGVRAFLLLDPLELPRSAGMLVDVRVLGFALAVGAVTALLFGLLPALHLIGRDVAGPLQARGRGGMEGRSAQRVRTALVVLEVALSLVLLAQAGSLLRSFMKLHTQELGFRTTDIWTLPLRMPRMQDVRHGGSATPADWVREMETIRAALAAVPGVSDATYGVTLPLEFTGGGSCCFRTNITAPGSDAQPRAAIHPVDAGFFSLFELRFIAGSAWQRVDDGDYPYHAVITEPVAIELFGSAQAAIGREVILSFQEDRSARVTGVVAPNRHYGPAQEPMSGVYIAAAGIPAVINHSHFAVRASAQTQGLARRLRDAVWRIDPDVPIPLVRPLEAWAAAATARVRFESLLSLAFAAVALLLVAGGLYGTLLYSVGRRRRELGVRLALGDAPHRLEIKVLSQGLLTATAGGAIGLLGAWGAGRLLQSRLFQTQANDPVTLTAALVLLLAVAIAASWLPARRAAATDPMEALRSD
jgi:predicted permease